MSLSTVSRFIIHKENPSSKDGGKIKLMLHINTSSSRAGSMLLCCVMMYCLLLQMSCLFSFKFYSFFTWSGCLQLEGLVSGGQGQEGAGGARNQADGGGVGAPETELFVK